MLIYVLKGNCDTGKTETIQQLIYNFYKRDYIIKPFPRYSSSVKELLDNGIVRNPSGSMKDISVIAEPSNFPTNIRIGITTYGDNESYLKEKIKLFYSERCDMCICARHTYHKGISELDKFILEHNFELIEIPKWIIKAPNNLELEQNWQKELNKKQSQEILELLENNIINIKI